MPDGSFICPAALPGFPKASFIVPLRSVLNNMLRPKSEAYKKSLLVQINLIFVLAIGMGALISN